MPGLAGFIGANLLPERTLEVDRMLKSMQHEVFHSVQMFASADAGIRVGWVRDSSVEQDCDSHFDPIAQRFLCFSGEPVCSSACESGSSHPTALCARDLLALYDQYGHDFLRRINGWVSGVLVDVRKKSAFLFNDQVGMNRLYFVDDQQGFYFASEAKALLLLFDRVRSYQTRALAELIICGCTLQNRSLFDGVGEIPGGSIWQFSKGVIAKRGSYFRISDLQAQSPLSERDYGDQLAELWTKIQARYISDRPSSALSLTGGVDSRMILATAIAQGYSMPCYTFGGMYRECADVTVSRRISELCGQKHQTIRLDRAFLRSFSNLLERTAYITDGSLDPTGTADLYVNRLARQVAPVRITGLNGGELLRRLIMFKPWSPPEGLFSQELNASFIQARETYTHEVNCHPLAFTAFKQAPWYLGARLSIERSQLIIRSPYFDIDLIALAYRAPTAALGIEPALRIVARDAPMLANVETDRANRIRAIPGLTKVKNTIQNFSFRAEYAYDYGMPQWLARVDHGLRSLHLERLFLGRHKFYHFRTWYKNELAATIKDILLDGKALSRSYVNKRVLERVVCDHIAGKGNHTTALHKLLQLEMTSRSLLYKRAS